ncbi:pali-domain-containing protein [Thelephora terrestris]|uniref:Pali-domain-containing protein n=1 Tax=Thelephora terrestris TaxID=56493 RepID=A0A9P6LC03_9AGAM|nr:pali-domain-containing protein [Thelephora terrestris]
MSTSRAFCVPGVFFLLAATVLLIITSVSLPFLPAIDFVRAHVQSGNVGVANTQGIATSSSISQLKVSSDQFGVWAYCAVESASGNRDCSNSGYAYGVVVRDNSSNDSVTIKSSWTRGLAVHPVAAVVSFIALLLSFSTHITVTLIASLVSFLAALITLIAFAIDIALFAFVKHEVGKLSGSRFMTNTAPAFWMTFAAFILLLLAGCTVCFGRRRQSRSYAADASEPGPYQSRYGGGFWNRFRRTPKI